ncbi:winged helix DNA-binding domain-containing protein [Pedobacter ginsengisoli]|uniref:winged helix DNA-binding domain-containing protein n=1 Tax=Pedobacter ginsengisoli TaxID=363852 RepID=UPI00254B9300|nr:winged helix DNA-binding domain-containing protein [Pedobacter ginsengisoli]
MKPADIINYRLYNQQIGETRLDKPEEVVNWMVAMQAQEYSMAKWAIGLRLKDTTETEVEKAYNEGLILRTHLMRPTWHFVSPEDIRWLTELSAPRIRQAMAYYERELNLDSKLFSKCSDIIGRSLEDGGHMTRNALSEELEKHNIKLDGLQMGHVMMNAETECLVTSGPREGKQFTYALFNSRAPQSKSLSKEEALYELGSRYFRSRGPATLKDFSVWSGLSITDAKKGESMLDTTVFAKTQVGDATYILHRETLDKVTELSSEKIQRDFLMPDYDEYGMSYIDRSAIYDPSKAPAGMSRDNPVFNRLIILDGVIEGGWKRILKGKSVLVETSPFKTLNKKQTSELEKMVKRFQKFSAHH